MRPSVFVIVASMVFVGLGCDSKPVTVSTKIATSRPGASEVELPPVDRVVSGQTLYIPAYSHVYTADSANPLNLATTLFVRNTDPSRPIIVTRVEYYDSGGKSLRSFVKSPLKVEPMASIDFFVKESDETGGPSPSFLVEWVATEAVSDPLAESVMIGTTGSQGISFTCPSRIVKGRKP